VTDRGGRPLVRRLQHTFAGRCAMTFVALQGVDRAMAIAAQAFTALIPLLIVVSAAAPVSSRNVVADAVINRFRLTGESAEIVEELFASSGSGSLGLLGGLLLVFSGVSLTKRLQRVFLQAWQLPALPGVRASLSAAFGLAALLIEIALLSLARSLGRALALGPTTGWALSVAASVLLWTSVPWLLLDRRIGWRRLLPFGVLTATCAGAYGIVSTLTMPRVLASYSERYGMFGVTLALVGWLLAISLIVVMATVIAAEFDRLRAPWAVRLRARLGIDAPAEDVAVSLPAAPREPRS
jgi:uncharacterized BrkB/YihY/UPF0761 family membrane protein